MREEIGAPPPPMTPAGRINREGVSYLYLSSDLDTVIAEVRPHPGHFVSIGEFEVQTDLRVADFENIDILNFFESDRNIEQYIFLNNLGKRFSFPVVPEERNRYLITQLAANVLRKLGYDAIKFVSSVGPGYNLAVFNSNNVAYIEKSSKLIKISSLKYTYQFDKYDPNLDYDSHESYERVTRIDDHRVVLGWKTSKYE